MLITPKEFLQREILAGLVPSNPAFAKLATKTVEELLFSFALPGVFPEITDVSELTVLDFGAGTGAYSQAFADAGFKVKALDIWKEHRNYMKEHCNGFTIVSKPQKAKLMLFIETAEHMTDEEITEAVLRVDPQAVLFSSTSDTTPNDLEWGHVNLKSQFEWLEFWKLLGYELGRDLKRPTKRSKLLRRV
jgi:2-polyprenyl-3-methyl-5-hydroxy-6-metoxy-1,4-benzoquinol methylase